MCLSLGKGLTPKRESVTSTLQLFVCTVFVSFDLFAKVVLRQETSSQRSPTSFKVSSHRGMNIFSNNSASLHLVSMPTAGSGGPGRGTLENHASLIRVTQGRLQRKVETYAETS